MDLHIMSSNLRKWLIRTIVLFILTLLLWWVFRKALLAEIWGAILQLHGWQVAIILALYGLFYLVATLCWWTIIRMNIHSPNHSRGIDQIRVIRVQSSTFHGDFVIF
jgi:hypothetical protein